MQLFGSFVDVKLMKIARPHSENMKREPHRIKSKFKCGFLSTSFLRKGNSTIS